MDKRAHKRWKREHAKRSKPKPEIELVYRPKTEEEARRRAERAKSLVGVPFIHLPGSQEQDKILFTTTTGFPVKVSDVEMVYNDAKLMDSISDHGKDGPLYRDTLDTPEMREVYAYAMKVYEGIEVTFK